MSLKIKLDVHFSSGAKVELSDNQLLEVAQHIESLILTGEAQTTKKVSVKSQKTKKVIRHWTEEEDKIVLKFTQDFPRGSRGREKGIQQLSQFLRRSFSGVNNRVWSFDKGRRAVTDIQSVDNATVENTNLN